MAARAERKRFVRSRRALALARPHSRSVLVVLALTLLVAGLNVAEPLLLKAVFDCIESGADARRLGLGLALFLGLGVLREALSNVSYWLAWRTRAGLSQRLF